MTYYYEVHPTGAKDVWVVREPGQPSWEGHAVYRYPDGSWNCDCRREKVSGPCPYVGVVQTFLETGSRGVEA